MTLDETRKALRSQYRVVHEIDLRHWQPGQWQIGWLNFDNQLRKHWQKEYTPDQRWIFIVDPQEWPVNIWSTWFKEFIDRLFAADISSWFAIILTTGDPDLVLQQFALHSQDPVPPQVQHYDASITQLTPAQNTFCILPWNHLMLSASQEVRTCCQGAHNLGRADTHSLEQVWQSDRLQEIRQTLLKDQPHPNCASCYAAESQGLLSLRQKSNRNFFKQVATVRGLDANLVPPFELRYLDLRFSNVCNMRCRTCDHHSSSRWYGDTLRLDPQHNLPQILKAGSADRPVWPQIMPQIKNVEMIYFAGGEPLIMQEHYDLLEELLAQGRTHVPIRYNTNFSVIEYRAQSVFDIWAQFDSVQVSASLDAEGDRAEYIRKDTNWIDIVHNRKEMLRRCPRVSFDVQPTVSILNVWHLPDFHRSWVEQGLIGANDWTINLLLTPVHLRVDIATPKFRKQVQQKIKEHCNWLAKFPFTTQVQKDYEAVCQAMDKDNSHHLKLFWQKTQALDKIRNENVLNVLPELKELL